MRKLRLRLYGPFSAIWADGHALNLTSSKQIALLALLATAPDGMRTRTWVQGLLWSLSGSELGRASLRRALSDLRKTLGDDFDQVFKVSNTNICFRSDAYEITGLPSDGEFLEGISISEPRFQTWLSQMRVQETVDPVRSASPPETANTGFARPAIAVLPFTFLQNNDHSEMLGDLLAQDFTRTLSKAKLFVVFSHLMARHFGKPDVDLKAMTENQPIDFVVYGTVRTHQDKFKIDADVADTRSGRLCSTHEFTVSVSDFLNGNTDLMFVMARQVAEAIVLSTVEQKLLDETHSRDQSSNDNNALRFDAEARAREVCENRLNFEDLIASQPPSSEFHTWLSRWYIEHLELSGIEAIRSKSNEQARNCFQKALDIAQDIGDTGDRGRTVNRLLLLLGPQLSSNHGFASTQVQEVYDKAGSQIAARIESPQRLQMLWGNWGAKIVKAEISRAEELSEEFLKIARENFGSLEVSAGHYMSGVGAFYVGDFARAEEAFLEAVEVSKDADFHDMITSYGMDISLLTKCYLGWCYALRGLSEKIEETSYSVELAAGNSDHVFSQALSFCFLSTKHNFLGNVSNAKKFGLMAFRLSKKFGFAQQAAHARINLGRVREKTGDPSGLRLMEEGLRAYTETGAVLARPYADAWIAESLIGRHEERGALERILKARRFTRKFGERYFNAELLRISAMATAGLRPDAVRRVENLLQMSIDQARRTGAGLHLLRALSDLEDLQFRGKPDYARSKVLRYGI